MTRFAAVIAVCDAFLCLQLLHCFWPTLANNYSRLLLWYLNVRYIVDWIYVHGPLSMPSVEHFFLYLIRLSKLNNKSSGEEGGFSRGTNPMIKLLSRSVNHKGVYLLFLLFYWMKPTAKRSLKKRPKRIQWDNIVSFFFLAFLFSIS